MSCIVNIKVFQEFLDLIRELLASRESRVLSLFFEVIIITPIGMNCVRSTYAFFSERPLILQGPPVEFEALALH